MKTSPHPSNRSTDAPTEIAIDVGGTFTDVVVSIGGRLAAVKVPTTPADLVQGVLKGIDAGLSKAGESRKEVVRIIHGSTVATNAFIQRRGATTALLTTKGFEDVIEIGRLKRSEMYNLFADPETPGWIVPGRLRAGITERVDAKGNVLVSLDESELTAAVDRFIREYRISSVAICFLFSFLNPLNEKRAKALIAQRYPQLKVSISSEIDPVIREYERTCVTVFDAYLRPVVEDYLRQLNGALEEAGTPAKLYIMMSRGGITTVDWATERAVQLLYSGPAAGVVGAREEALRSGIRDFISIDIGGTSCDAALVTDAAPAISTERTIGKYPLRIPMVDVSTIGAGGGSIARVDAGGSLRVGPISAGADPGPACYGRGGENPTVTDASLMLGYLNPQFFAGGQFELITELADRAIKGHVASPLGMDVLDAAWGIHRIVNANMAEQVRLISIGRGYDPRRFALVVLGGAGPVHGGAIATELSIPRVLVPRKPGVLSAAGLLAADIEHDFAAPYLAAQGLSSASDIEKVFDGLHAEVLRRMAIDGVAPQQVRFIRLADMRYVGQRHELTIPLPEPTGSDLVEVLGTRFHRRHQEIYGYASPDRQFEFVSLRVVATFRFDRPSFSMESDGSGAKTLEDAHKETRGCYFGGGRREPVPVFDRSRLPVGAKIHGPAIIEQGDTTTVIYPGQSASADSSGNLIIFIGER